MSGVKLIVMYPRPKDIDAFEKAYQNEHVPMAMEKLKGVTKFVATKVVGSPQGTPPFHRIAELHFASMESLQACAGSRWRMLSRFRPEDRPLFWWRKNRSPRSKEFHGAFPHVMTSIPSLTCHLSVA